MVIGQTLVQFKVPISISISEVPGRIDTLWLGVHGDGPNPPGTVVDNTYGPDIDSPTFGPWKEWANPPDGMDWDFVSKFIQIPFRTAPNPDGIYPTGLRPNDFRGYTSPTQVDTFQMNVYGDGNTNLVGSGTVTIAWPAGLHYYATNWELKKRISGTNYITVVSDMGAAGLASWTDANTSGDNSAKYLIIKTGALQPPPGPLCAVAGSAAFGIVSSMVSTRTLAVTNPGDQTLIINAISAPPDFVVTPATPITAAGQFETAAFTVTFDATGKAAGTYSGTIVLTHNAVDGTTTTIPVSATIESGPTCNPAPTSINFGHVSSPITTSTITITNAGFINALVISDISAPAGFSAVMSNMTVAINSSQTLTVTFDATGLVTGIYSGNIILTHNAVDGITTTIPVSVTIDTGPTCDPAPASLFFGNVSSTITTKTITITNAGYMNALLISDVSATTGFSAVMSNMTVAANSSQTLTVTFNATGLVTGTYSGTIVLTHNATPTNTSIPVSATIVNGGELVQFKVPIIITVSTVPGQHDSLCLGIHGDGPNPPGTVIDNTYGPDIDLETYGLWKEWAIPPDAMYSEDFISKFVQIPSRTALPPDGIYATGLKPNDFRGFTSPSQVDTFSIVVYGSLISYPVASGKVTISWPADLHNYAKTWELKKRSGTGYATVVSDMGAAGLTSWTDENTSGENNVKYLIIKTGAFKSPPIPGPVAAGWNLLSVPSMPPNKTASVVFPGSFGDLFGYNPTGGGYVTAPTLSIGYGYWAYYTSETIENIVGNSITGAIQVPCKQGWNLIGSRERVVLNSELTTVPSGGIYGDLFSFDPSAGSYIIIDRLIPGKGAWVYMLFDCTLVIPQ
jgi:hypothetical protein